MPEATRDRQRLKLWIDKDVLDQARARAEAESSEVRTVHLADVARDALFSTAAQTGAAQERITLRESADRRKWPLWVDRVPYQAAKDQLRERGLSVAAVVEHGLIKYVQRRNT